jgi:signal transduction histidine kinase
MHYSDAWPVLRIDELLYEVIASCYKMFENITIDFHFESVPDDEKHLMARGNDVLLKSAFRNLIKNAYLYSNDQKVDIFIQADNPIQIHFINSGKQLTPPEAEQLMVPFFRGHNAASIKGFGLGLSIVNRILALHKGQLQYTAEGNSKNKFSVIIPSIA